MYIPRCAALAPCISCVHRRHFFPMQNPPSLSFLRSLSSFGIPFAFVPAAFLHAGYSYGANKTLAYFRLIAPFSCLHRVFSAPLLHLVSFFSGLRYYRTKLLHAFRRSYPCLGARNTTLSCCFIVSRLLETLVHEVWRF